MRNILCFGDSNTYGYNPADGSRFPEDVRWTGLLQEKAKGGGYRIIEEGLVGRTTIFEDSVRMGRKGSNFLLPLLETHYPVDAVVLMLGTNDCKTVYNASSHVIGKGMEVLLKQVKNYDASLPVLLLSPIYLGEGVWEKEYDPEFNRASVEVSRELKTEYGRLAKLYGYEFLAASDVAEPSSADREHMDEEGHRALADAVWKKLQAMAATEDEIAAEISRQ